jgi:branched-chain amino acid transport system permease protein
MKLVNFAHGQLLMIGAFITYTIATTFNLNVYISILIAMAVVAIIGIGIERFTFRKVLGTDKLNEIFVSLGLIYILENAAVLAWSDKSKQLISPLKGTSLNLGSLFISYDRLMAMATVAIVLIGLFFLLKKTRIGLAMRATSQKNITASLMGININHIYLITFALGAALACLAGALYGIILPFSYLSGELPTTKAFAIVIIGGLGSIPGAIVGGLLYGIAEQFATLFFGSIWADAVAFALLITVLVIRPTGLFGEKGE